MHKICQKNYEKKCHDTNVDIYMALFLYMACVIKPSYTPLNRPTRGTLPRFNRQLVLYDNDDSNLTVLVYRQPKSIRQLILIK